LAPDIWPHDGSSSSHRPWFVASASKKRPDDRNDEYSYYGSAADLRHQPYRRRIGIFGSDLTASSAIAPAKIARIWQRYESCHVQLTTMIKNSEWDRGIAESSRALLSRFVA
jgi:hypothetical protein